MTAKTRVAVAMSGGVDSSVAAAMLVEQGFDVVGLTMRVKPEDDRCTQAVEDARRMADKLGIQHHVVDLRDVFEREVIRDFVSEYAHGRTPNPCVRCNPRIKFGVLMEHARTLEAERMATGHYVRVSYNEETGRRLLMRGLDASKDQSYALCGLNQDQLSRIIAPLGDMKKDETRALAERIGLEVFDKPDSQEICFVDNKDYPAFLQKYAPDAMAPGPILDTTGNEIGRHNGIAFYTVGQRKRIGIAAREPLYTIRLDPERNAVVVGQNADLYCANLLATDFNLISIKKLEKPIAVTAKVRYNMKDCPAVLTPLPDGMVRVTFDEPQRAITPGQAVVCYNDDIIVGGGTILNAD